MRYINSARRLGREEGIEQSVRNLLLKGISPEETDKKTVLKIAKEIRAESELKAA